MKHLLCIVSFLATLTTMSAKTTTQDHTTCPMGFYSLKPATTWEESLVTGNGIMGAMIEGNALNEKIVVNHHELFLPLNPIMLPPTQGKHLGEIRQLMKEGKYNQASQLVVDLANAEGYRVKHASDCYVPAFQICISDADNKATVNNYKRGVNFETGEVSVDYSTERGSYTRRTFASRADSLVVISLTAKSGKINAFVNIERVTTADPKRHAKFHLGSNDLLKTELAGRQQNALYFRAQFDIPQDGCSHKGYDGYEGVVDIVKCDGKTSFVHQGFQITEATEVLLLCKVQMTTDFKYAGISDLKKQLDNKATDYTQLLKPHVALHKPLMDKVAIDLGATEKERQMASEDLLALGGKSTALIERLFNAGRYNALSSIGISAPSLSGIWGATMTPNWSGDFTTNGNLPVAISHLLQSGTPELMLPLFRQLEDKMEDFRTNAKTLFGCRGIHIPSHFTWHGYDNQFDATWPMTFWHAGAPWYGLFYYDYYLYTQDKEFLRKHALPFMEEAALFLEDFLPKEGQADFNPSYSPENYPLRSAAYGKDDKQAAKDCKSQACINATMDVASSRMLLEKLIEASHILGVNKDKIAKWKDLADRMPKYELNSNGELREWLWKDDMDNHQHRHASHLIGLYDLHDHQLTDRADLRSGCLKTIDRRMAFRRKENTGVMAFGICQLAFSAAALGSADRCEEMLGWLGSNYFRNNLFSCHDPHDIFNCDISGGYPSLVMKMLAYAEPGTIQLFPAKPASWKKGCVKGMKLRGNILVDMLSWDGNRHSATLTSPTNQTVTLLLPDNSKRTVKMKKDKPVNIKF